MSSLSELAGRTVADRFELLDTIGEGGMGAVYRARQRGLDRIVALKIIRPELGSRSVNVERFLREAAAAAKMGHSNTVRLFDFGREEDGLMWMAMEYLEGQTVYELLDREGRQAPARVVHIAEQVASALQHAHECGIVHRDIKPANIMLAREGEDPDHVKVVDFGLAWTQEAVDNRLTSAGTVMGTPAYLSPEQLDLLDTLDGRTDLYALGMVMYELLAGNLPYPSESANELMRANLELNPLPFEQLDPPIDDVPAELEKLVLRLLEKDPEDRPPTAAATAKALHRLARRLGGTAVLRNAQGIKTSKAREFDKPTRTPKDSSRPPAKAINPSNVYWILAVIGLSALVVVVGVVMFLAGMAM